VVRATRWFLSAAKNDSARALKLRCESSDRAAEVPRVLALLSGGRSEGDGVAELLELVDELANPVFG
jgi:hypothetical protein